MPALIDLVGARFGRLVVERESGRDERGGSMWDCACDCGASKRIRSKSLRSGKTRSCGCGVADAARLKTTHGASRSPLYARWRLMLGRCASYSPEFRNYAGRGIVVCERWRASFESFRDDMGSTFDPSLELDRIDVDGNYEPGNCRWVTKAVQQSNRRNNHRITHNGVTLTVKEWGDRLGIKPNTIITRMRRGWSVERSLATDSEVRVAAEGDDAPEAANA